MNKINLIIRREFNERVRKRSFLVSTILAPLLMIGLFAGMIFVMTLRSDETKTIEVIDNSGIVSDRLESTGTIVYKPADRTLEQINADHEGIWGVLVIGDIMNDAGDVKLYSYSSSTVEIESSIASALEDIVEAEKLKRYNIENLPRIMAEVETNIRVSAFKVDDSGQQKSSSSALAMGLAYALGLLMYMFVMLYGNQVMNGVIEEKNSKVLEVVVSSVRPFQLMMGKIIGIACVAVTQFVIWVAVLGIGSAAVMNAFVPAEVIAVVGDAGAVGAAMPEGLSPEMISAIGNLTDLSYVGKMLAVFLVFFVGGYLLYAAMYAAVGSAVDNIQDAGQFQMPITVPLLFGLIGMINAMNDPSGPLAFWLSIIPFTSPMVMVARIPYGVPMWELGLSVGLLILTFVAMVWLAGKIYRVGIFMYGKKPTPREILRWVRYK